MKLVPHIRNTKSTKKCFPDVECPHCENKIFMEWTGKRNTKDPTGNWPVLCPFCERPIIVVSITCYGATDDPDSE